ncbi:ribosome assembly factor SBDS [Candidatus Woesearchaeota archaeon]|jgi:ribosome maturation protein SDO1|nr:ribosome assembly factor SBDS [Candidatus Woesearchaeota archaeon]MBT6023377.1 ribosome assembly factor SBDS [Candidatus Woesearchaeota archaeon]
MQQRTYDKERVSFTLARLKKGGENFEVVISDVDKAIEFKQGKELNPTEFLQSTTIFQDANRGLKVSEEKVKNVLGESAIKKILQDGELHLTADQRKRLSEERKNRIIEHIQRNSVDPKTGSPHPRTRVELAMTEAKVSIDYQEKFDTQIEKVINAIRVVIPLSFEKIKLKITIPAQYAGSAYSSLKSRFKNFKEEWLNDGSVVVELEVVGGAKADLYSLISKVTNGEAEITEQ